MSQFLDYLSVIFGWFYVILWSSSFYPMIWTIIQLKSAEGVKCDYQLLNITGYIMLSAYSTAGFFYPEVDVGQVDIEDLAFAYHGFLAVSFIIGLMIYYPRGDNKIDKIPLIGTIIMWIITLTYLLSTTFLGLFQPPFGFNVWKLMGYDKLVISVTKYIPQVLWNYRRKKTVGWNIQSTILDLLGGILSFIQSFIDQYNSGKKINQVKLILGLITIIYDLIFMFQHYILYNPNNKSKLDPQNLPQYLSLKEQSQITQERSQQEGF